MIGGAISNLYCDNNGNIFVGPYAGGVFRGINSTLIPPKVQLVYPKPIARDLPLTINFKWRSSPSAINYNIQISTTESFDSASIIYEYLINDTTVLSDSLLPNSKYHWRVRSSNDYGFSIWSSTWSFTTLILVDILTESQPIKEFHLSQNYPNPFNPSTKISWQSPVSSHQTLKVYDVLGNEIATLVNEEKPAGNYEVEFNASMLSSGIYFYKLQAGSFVETKKIVLIR
jgi:hypothetical protein